MEIMKKQELINILNSEIEKEHNFINSMETKESERCTKTNEMVNHSKGRISAFEDILYYAQHNSTLMFREG